MATLTPRVVVVTRATELTGLLERHGTMEQARFFLSTRGSGRGRSLEIATGRHEVQVDAERQVLAAIPTEWRRARVDRHDLARFLFEPEDVVVAVGQDGLVANVAKYLEGQRVIGIDPEPGRNAGVLVQHAPERIAALLASATAETGELEHRTMVEARIDDGQILRAVNEIFVGHHSHQSARYRLRIGDQEEERQSSSGVVITTGTGATGWARSICRDRRQAIDLPAPEEPRLCFMVREAWPSPSTGTTHCDGSLEAGATLRIISEMDEGGVVFGDGIEEDHLELGWGQTVRVGLCDRALLLVH